jgi:signal transduction histidine kinase
MLQEEGYDVLEASDGTAAVRALRQGIVDVALLDLLMAGMNGLQLLRELQRLGVDAPVILFTSFGGVRTAVEAMQLGAADYLLKPLQREEVLQALTRALAKRPVPVEAPSPRDLEARLRQAQKLESLGRLTSAVAHDLNNQVTVMLGYSQLLLDCAPAGDPLRENLEEIQKASERAAGLTRQLLTFSRKQQPDPVPVDLNALITGMDRMLNQLIGKDLDLAITLQPDLGTIRADPGQLEQVLMNLAINARDAMPEGGSLSITTANVLLDCIPAGRINGSSGPEPYVMLTVTDTGCGMDAATQAHLFEPFFTTKDYGTGLGLTIVREIIQHSGGTIQVTSSPDQGTTFTIYLPCIGEAPDLPAAARPAVPVGSETILLVEDNEGVRSMLREFLRRHGYTVLEASTSDAALRLCEQYQEPIDLLVTDVVMPQMDGPELVQRMTALRPSLRVLYMSGYPSSVLAQHGVASPHLPFLQKPFSMDALALEIREVLDHAPQGVG